MKNSERKALTLVEVIISSAVFVGLAFALYLLLHTGISVKQKMVKEGSDLFQLHLSLERIAREVRNLVVFKKEETGFWGEDQTMGFYSLVFDYKEDAPRIKNIVYKINGTTLTKTTIVPFQNTGENEIVFIENLESLHFFYIAKGTDEWVSVWDNKEVLPAGIKIALIYRDQKGKKIPVDKYVYIYQQ